uniref:Uncharacterized protein n=1 Tax=Acrobeloides nanus TaxID=290746 RepID=A0A914CXS3_9BILA
MLFKLFKCASKPKKHKDEIKFEIEKLKLENQELDQKVAELTNYIKTLEAAASKITDSKNTNGPNQLDVQNSIEEHSVAAKKDEIPIKFSQLGFNSDDNPQDSCNAENSIFYLTNEAHVDQEILRSLSEIMTSENASDLESTDNISALENTISRESRRIRRMPTPLMKPPSQLSTPTYENLFDRRTGKPKNDSRTKAWIKKLYQIQS